MTHKNLDRNLKEKEKRFLLTRLHIHQDNVKLTSKEIRFICNLVSQNMRRIELAKAKHKRKKNDKSEDN